MTNRCVVLLAVAFGWTVLAPPRTAAQVASSLVQLQLLVERGNEVTVTRVNGTVTKGKVDHVEASTLRLLQGTTSVPVSESEVREIRKRDPLRNGTWLGAVVGGTVGTALGTIGAFAFCGEFDCTPEAIAGVFLTAGLGAGIGAGVGLSMDSAFNRNPIVFRALPASATRIQMRPLLARGQKGFHVSISF